MSAHDVTHDQLVQHVLGELSAEQNRDVEAHLRRCEPCGQAVGRLTRLLDCAGRMGSVGMDEHLVQSANREVLLAAKTENKDQSRHRVQSPAVLFGRMIMKARIVKPAVAAVVALAVIVALTLSTGDEGGKVYARAVGQLHNARTLIYSVVTKTGVDGMPTVRMDVAFKDTGFVRTATADGYITVAQATGNKVKGIAIVPVAKNFVTFEVDNMPDDPAKDPWAMIEMLRGLPARADRVLGRRELDGRMLDGFRVREDDTIATVWIDPASGQLARVELECPSAPGMNVIMSDFQFDVPLEDAFFSLEPPEGYIPLGVQADVAGVGERDFVEFLRAWSLWTVDATFPPLVAGPEIAKIIIHMAQEDRFKAGWDFDFGRQQVVYRSLVFISGLPAGTWRYAGQNVSFGDPAVPIFWYQPPGSATWRVIYADLSVADAAPDDLPK